MVDLIEHAISLVLAQWSTLNLVVKEGFAGTKDDTAYYVNLLLEDAVAICSPSFKKDKELALANLLEDSLVQDFNCELLDDSEMLVVARHILLVVDHALKSTEPEQTIESNFYLKEVSLANSERPLDVLLGISSEAQLSSDSEAEHSEQPMESGEAPEHVPSEPQQQNQKKKKKQKVVDADGFISWV
ncbi:hypothetical protein RCL1_000034 [Eukaryota sp. TZLM3-RCL]